MRSRRPILRLLAAGALFVAACGCEQQAKDQAGAAPRSFEEAPLSAFQSELLDLAFDTASAIWINPHVKNRARAQQEVVETCLELGQPKRALGYIEQIPNWRRGLAYADLACWMAGNGYGADQVQPYLDLAARHGKDPDQEWRWDRVRVRIAEACVRLGQMEEASRYAARVEPSEAGKVAGALAGSADRGSFEEHMTGLSALLASEHFDIRRNALMAATRLYDRFYDNAVERRQVDEIVRASWGPMPLGIRIDLLLAMAGSAVAHADQATALTLVNDAQAIMEGTRWPLEYYVPLVADVATARFRAGDEAKALADARAALARFDAEKNEIIDMFRAQALRPLAEAFQAMGDAAGALEVYRRAVEEGVANPSLRTRAEDLAATCASMASAAVEPDSDLWARMQKIRESLGQAE